MHLLLAAPWALTSNGFEIWKIWMRLPATSFVQKKSQYRDIQSPKRVDAFFACWTRKEAYIKATGEGLSASLDTFRVTLRPCEVPSFVHIDGNASEARSWSLYSLRPAEGYIGALAFRGRRNIRVFVSAARIRRRKWLTRIFDRRLLRAPSIAPVSARKIGSTLTREHLHVHVTSAVL